ncbi:MAG: TMEM165/GDT1 family protein [Myxococcota bacterium]|nr:TMEM165/GDT1 family protein [Myxococcota bacterium]
MRTLDLAVSVFGVIFIAEVPDKTALAALVLATRYKALPVFLGAAAALSIQSLVAVAAGSLFALLPARPVHVGAGMVFLASAAIMWVRKEPSLGDTPVDSHGADNQGKQSGGAPGFWRAAVAVFGVIFIAEWGDLTQLATAAIAARERAPLVVFASATLALWVVTATAVLVGNRTARILSPRLVQKVAALLFVAIGAALLLGWL